MNTNLYLWIKYLRNIYQALGGQHKNGIVFSEYPSHAHMKAIL